MKKKIILFLIGMGVFVSVLLTSAGVLLYTPQGAGWLSRKIFSHYFPSGKVSYESVTGNFSKGLHYKNIVIQKLEKFPAGSQLKAQNVTLAVSFFGERWYRVAVENARIRITGADTMVLNGTYDRGFIAANIFCQSFDLENVRGALKQFHLESSNLSGNVRGLDLNLSGRWPDVTVQGQFFLPRLSWERFTAENVPVALNVTVLGRNPFQMAGILDFKKGTVSGPRTAVVQLKPSRMIFKGDVTQPTLELRGTTKVSGTGIDVALGGTPHAPDLRLSSDPPLAQTRLLAMLVTNKSWQGTADFLKPQGVPVNLAKDFIDYFAFGGMGSELGKQLGIEDFSLTFDTQQKGFSLQKELTRKMSATYGFSQGLDAEGGSFRSQSYGGAYHLDETTTLGIEQRIKQPFLKTPDLAAPEAMDKEWRVRFKKDF